MINIKEGNIERLKTEAVVIPLYKDVPNNTDLFKKIDNSLNGILSSLVEEKKNLGDEGNFTLFFPNKRIAADRVLLAGLGEKDKLTSVKIRNFSGNVCNSLKRSNVSEFSMLPLSYGLKNIHLDDAMNALCEGIFLSSYAFDKYKTKKKEDKDKPSKIASVTFLPSNDLEHKSMQKGIDHARILADPIYLVRDLVNGPANEVHPAYMADAAEAAAKKYKFKCKVFEENELRKMNMNIMLAVSQGSVQKPKMIVVEHKPVKSAKTIAIVGKGITFDSGGLQVKQGKTMFDMKSDMTGAATVLGTVAVAAQLNLPVHVIGIMACVENMPSGSAYRPGDIFTSASGKTVEIWHTDAEGRLVLGDALHYATTQKPDVIIDLATLTGAIVVSLGSTITGLFSNNNGLVSDLKKASEATGEKIWQLPIEEEHSEMVKSDIADLKNLGSYDGDAGSITAAAFLKEFVGETPWAHFDIAGTAMTSKDLPTGPKGATGVMVRTLINYLQNVGDGRGK